MKIGARLDGGGFQRIEALVAAVRRRAMARAEVLRATRTEAGTRPRETQPRVERGDDEAMR
ncbi:hypothetical protein W911_12505 [Hyphomicrobium nitrativorans NL23]|uniref:Uncharacterized protein n=1 Tax=Hyphomicrobium nitrativorans NL23 TaxID=1029756 RepID=V5SJJ0_9HYPH|nr:hypothetical protein W911_12505 [Hyphomicrobium nitrativorans NL23]